jgi:hypothetical protein
MPNEYRVRQVNRLESVGAPAVRTFQALQRSGQGPCMRSGAAVRSAEELQPVLSIGRDEYRRHGNSAVRAGVDGAGGACVI